MKVLKQLLEMKFSQDMMVYNPFPSFNPVKKSHETGNDKMEWETPFVSSEMYLWSKKLAFKMVCFVFIPSEPE